MVEIGGKEYEAKDPVDNANSLVEFINNYCATNNVVNKDGDVINIDANVVNPLYMLCYGLGYLVTELQTLLVSAGSSTDIARASDRQILNLAQMAGISRRPASATSISALIYAGDDGDCEITKDLSFTYAGHVYHPATSVIIKASQIQRIVLLSEEKGSFAVPENRNAHFDTDPDNMRQMITDPSTPGAELETIQSLRKRIQDRGEDHTRVETCADAIAHLEGVTQCSIHFNHNYLDDETINGVTIGPKMAYVTVQGYSDKVSETFYKYLLCLTAGDGQQAAIKQDYKTLTGQVIPFYFFPPRAVTVFIRVYVLITDLTQELITGFQDSVLSLISSLEIGQEMNEGDLIKVLQKDYPLRRFTRCELSTNSVDYYSRITVEPDQLIHLSRDTIEVLAEV